MLSARLIWQEGGERTRRDRRRGEKGEASRCFRTSRWPVQSQ